jgi:inner membrane protein
MVPQTWNSFSQSLLEHIPSMGVRFMLPVDNYQKNNRSAKYAILIISLTFMLFFFFEMFWKKIIHIIQYIFIGLSLCIFYLLVLSFSEHLGFNLAYLISSHATIALTGFYSYYILRNVKSIMVLILGMASLYGYIFVLLQMETFALISGSIGLFLILSLAMYASRQIDWYNIEKLTGDSAKVCEEIDVL